MEVPGKLIIVGAIGCMIIGAEVDHRYNAKETVKTQTVEHETTKYVVITKTHEVDKPDGTKIIDSTAIDNGSQSEQIIQKIVDQKVAQTPTYLAAVGYGVNANKVRIYSLSIDKKLLGLISIGGYISTGSEIGVRVGVQF